MAHVFLRDGDDQTKVCLRELFLGGVAVGRNRFQVIQVFADEDFILLLHLAVDLVLHGRSVCICLCFFEFIIAHWKGEAFIDHLLRDGTAVRKEFFLHDIVGNASVFDAACDCDFLIGREQRNRSDFLEVQFDGILDVHLGGKIVIVDFGLDLFLFGVDVLPVRIIVAFEIVIVVVHVIGIACGILFRVNVNSLALKIC